MAASAGGSVELSDAKASTAAPSADPAPAASTSAAAELNDDATPEAANSYFAEKSIFKKRPAVRSFDAVWQVRQTLEICRGALNGFTSDVFVRVEKHLLLPSTSGAGQAASHAQVPLRMAPHLRLDSWLPVPAKYEGDSPHRSLCLATGELTTPPPLNARTTRKLADTRSRGACLSSRRKTSDNRVRSESYLL